MTEVEQEIAAFLLGRVREVKVKRDVYVRDDDGRFARIPGLSITSSPLDDLVQSISRTDLAGTGSAAMRETLRMRIDALTDQQRDEVAAALGVAPRNATAGLGRFKQSIARAVTDRAFDQAFPEPDGAPVRPERMQPGGKGETGAQAVEALAADLPEGPAAW